MDSMSSHEISEEIPSTQSEIHLGEIASQLDDIADHLRDLGSAMTEQNDVLRELLAAITRK